MSAAMQDCRDTPLSIPALPDDVDALTAALAYAAAGWYLVPVRRGTKHPGSVLGEHWPALSSRDREVIVSWFAGTDHGIALHVGRSGAVVFDIDTPEKAPITLLSAERECNPPTQRTRSDRRRHLVFAVPPGRTLSNQRGKLGIGWGEVRGTNGVIIVAPSVHPSGGHYRWVVTGVVPMLPHGVADMLPDAGPGEAAADSATVAEFARRYGTGDGSKSINGPLRTFADRLDEGDSRHEALVAVACWACREARAGAYPATEARARLREAFVLSMAHAKGEARLLPPQAARYEFDGMWAWAVGQAPVDGEEEEPVAEAGAEVVADGAEEVGEEPAEASNEDSSEEEEWTPEELRARRHERLIAEELEKLEVRDAAKRRMRDKDREKFRALRGKAFLDDGAELTYLVPRLLYQASTSKIYGPPGAGKTNLALDIALSAATGTAWRGVDKIEARPVHFIMAEGEAVNRMRVAAFVHRHEVGDEALNNFVAIPQGVLLTPEGIAEYLELVKQDKPGLVFLDTKNAMMDGDENAASDVAVMIRAMRMIRDAGERTCVVLIDHTGLSDESRGRGSNAVTAAMDTEIRVTKSRRAGAIVYSAEVTRDKASSEFEMAGFSFTLHPVDINRPDGVPAPPVAVWDDRILTREPEVAVTDRRWFEIPNEELPAGLQELDEQGAPAARDAFRVLMRTDDPQGITASDVRSALEQDMRARKTGKPYSKATFMRGWALLKPGEEFPDGGYIEQGSTKTKWRAKPGLTQVSSPRSEEVSRS